MKDLTIKKQLKNEYDKIISINYCNAQNLLFFQSPNSYCTSNLYGWRCDNYDIDDVLISTGYEPLDNRNANTNKLEHFEKAARKIRDNYTLSYEQKQKQVNKLLFDFIKNATREA